MMRFNSHVGPVRTQMTSTQKIPNDNMNTQNIANLQVCYLDKRESKGINVDKILSHVSSMEESKSKPFIVNACSLDERESKSIHVSINTNEVNMQ